MSEEEKQGNSRSPGPPDRRYPPRRPPGRMPPRPEGGGPKKANPRALFFWFMVISLAAVLALFLQKTKQSPLTISYSEFKQELKENNIKSVLIIQKEVKGEFRNAVTKKQGNRTEKFEKFATVIPFEDPELVKELEQQGVEIKAKQEGNNLWNVLLAFGPWVLLIFVWLFFLRQMQGGGGAKGLFSFGKSRARLIGGDRPKVTFADVAGVNEAKEELQEIIEFLKEPAKFQKLGGKIPKGVLLLGPPGTGKTLLARAIAGEAGVPFFSMSGSDFVEMFVGVGASRVRDLFEQGKRNAPCIIFIDEIDAVGRHRGAGLGGGHDEREQTLNQLLVEMDGFETNEGVILLAATNRPDVLDPALLRPGRFDRQIIVNNPDVKGREGILKVHTKKLKLAPDVDMQVLARATPGLSGADLANLVNEAALLAARKNREAVAMGDFEAAKDRVMMGIERKSLVISEEERKLTAYHEAGHALVAKLIPGSDPVYKVTIIPRGMALGVTSYLPIDEKHNYSKEYLDIRLVHLLAGRVAEKLVFNQLSTGAGNDIERATELARKMVCEWGMSEKLGPVTFGKKEEEIFLGREIARHRDYSEKTAQDIDLEVKSIVIGAEQKATELLSTNLDKLHLVAQTLLEKEILDGEQIDRLLKGGSQAQPEAIEAPKV